MERDLLQRLSLFTADRFFLALLALIVACQAQAVVIYSEDFNSATLGNVTTSNPGSTPTGTRGFGATATISTAGAADIVQVTTMDNIFGTDNQYLRFTESAGGTSASLLSSADISGLGGGGVAQLSFKAYVPNNGLTADGILVVLNDGTGTSNGVRTVNLDFKLIDTDADTIPDSPAISFQSAAPVSMPVLINYGQVYSITVAANYSTTNSVNYALGAETLGTTSFDVYLDGIKVRDDVLFRSTILNPSTPINDADRFSVRGSGGSSVGTVYFDDFVLQDTIRLGLPSVTVDRTTGSITLVNSSGSAIEDIVGYSILTPSGTLNTADDVWNSVGDSNPFWVDFSEDDGTEITESNVDQTSSPITLANNSSRNFGNIWYKHYQEDITFQLLIDDGSDNGLFVNLPVTFIGGTGAYPQGDINFDGLVNEADVTKFAQNFYQPLTGTIPGATYAQGDFNGDLLNDHADLLAFRTIYDLANGDGAFFLAMTAVPEPSTFVPIAILLGVAGFWKRKQMFVRCSALSTLLALFVAEQSQATVVFQENFNSITVGETISTTNSGFTTSATQLVPNNLAVIQDDTSNFFDPSAGNRYLHFADGNMLANGNSNPRIIAPANLTSAKGFEFSFDFYEVSDAGGEDVRIGLGDSAYGTGSRSIDFELKGTSFKNRGSEQVVSYGNNTKYTAKAIGNYGTYPIVYNGGNDFVLPGQYDVWLNSAKVIDNQAMANGAPKTTHLGIGGGSSDGLGSVFIDNIKVEDTVSSFSYQGEALLTLEVNTSTGQLQIKNTYSGFSLDLDFYKITGPAGSMNLSGWNSLDDQEEADPGDQGWIQAIGSTSFLAEFTLDNSQTSVTSGAPINLGTAYNTGSGAAGSLVFQYSLNGSNIYTGLISVVTSTTLDGDFNDDGIVNLADYTVWRDNLGAASDTAINNAGDGVPGVTNADYNVWKGNFGVSSGAITGVSSSLVPEPSSMFFVGSLVGVLGLHCSFRKLARWRQEN